ncbi:MAG: DUF1854 domain-containing protein [Capsulimonadales bacterium]|nr:DUF1854 domain-containing protein [Capsulimonadales bacterium]
MSEELSAPTTHFASGVMRLTPQNTRIYEGTHSGQHTTLHCVIEEKTLYRGVFAVRLFPIRHPDHFIALNYTDEEDKVREIGVIERPETFPDDARDLVRRTLARHYYEQRILRIYRVKLEHDMLFFDAGTQRGRESFIVPWRHDRAEEYDEHGKVLLDARDNRYIIPNVLELPERDRLELTRFIYW